MFVQLIHARINPDDAAELRHAVDAWADEIAPGATGWLGSTSGVTSDGQLIAIARFESAEAAQRNSTRPEQDAWWTQMSKLFLDEPTFRESTDVNVDLSGNPDTAGFVQLMQGRSSNPDRAKQILTQNPEEWAAFRPDILGQVALGFDEGRWAMVLYFRSVEDARAGEQKAPPPHLAEQMDELNALNIGVPEFIDLEDPWLHAPQ